MAILLEAADTGTNLDITTEQSIGSYTASGAKMVLAQIRLSNLNGAAATITAKMQHTDASDTLIGTVDTYARAKDAAANTVWSGRLLGPVYLANGEKVICKVTSTNASDTAAGWSVEWLDATIDTTDLAKEATLEAIKGAGWSNETLKAIYDNVPDIDLSAVATQVSLDAVAADTTKVKASVYDSASMGNDGYIVLSNGTRVLVSAAGRAITES